MIINSNKSCSAIIVIVFALLAGTLSSAALSPQQPQRVPTPEEQRKRMLERLSRGTQQTQPGTKQPANQVPPPAAPAPIPAQPAATAAPAAPQAPAVPPAAGSIQRDSGKVQLNYENADLYDFINQISGMLGLSPLIVDPEVKGNVNIINTGPMTKDEVLPLFHLILKNNNAAVVKQGNIYQIVPISSALKKGVDLIEVPEPIAPQQPSPEKQPADAPEAGSSKGAATPQAPDSKVSASSKTQGKDVLGNSRMATHVVRVEFVPVKDLIEPIKLFMTEGGVIMPYDRLNMLILTDYTDSANRVLEIIHMLDNNYLDPDLVELIKINHNAAADVAEDLKKIFGSGTKDSATGINFIPIERLNALFVIASSKRSLQELKRWIGELDAESSRNIQTFVYVVENSTASNIAMMLSALYGGEGSGSGAGGSGSSGPAGMFSSAGRNTQTGAAAGAASTAGGAYASGGVATPFGAQSYNQGYGAYGGAGGYMGGGAFGTGQRLGPQLNVSRSITSQILRGGEFSGLQDTVRMVVDDINNSLIIQATSVDYAYLLDTIKKMDVLPRQVIIDARIFEVDLTNTLKYGVNAYLQSKTAGEHLTTGSLEAGALAADTFAFVGKSREILLKLDALRTKTKVRILEAPSVLALDGMQASINVGSEVPYPAGSYTSSAGGSTTSIQYRETGVTLLVLPRISASGAVTLDITQEVSSPGATVNVGGEEATSFAKSLVTTSFYVKDGDTVAIAGLIHDKSDTGRSGIPLLSEIPILGSLFGSTNRNSVRSELIILITPHVIRTHEKLQDMTQDLRDSLRNVRKFADEKEEEILDDVQDARKDREKQQKKLLKKETPSQPEK
ncbi:MAG: type II secretion system secretin GspD [Acidobacteriota bacterium]|nr:type II secretion system secretin GspD [Acidobacteriota bacterium]